MRTNVDDINLFSSVSLSLVFCPERDLSGSNDLEVNGNPINHATSPVDIDSARTIGRVTRPDRWPRSRYQNRRTTSMRARESAASRRIDEAAR